MRKPLITKSEKGVKILIWITVSLISILLIFVLLREAWAASIRHKAAIDTSDGINSTEYVEINGIKQAVNIRGENINNPVLLFLHGGPGFTDMPVSYRYQTDWEKYFTVVQWDQRMAGKTYIANKNSEQSLDDGIDLRISDTVEITRYLLKRFDKDKLVLVGHSWGSVLGLHVVEKSPELYSAYVGIGFMTNLLESETLGYEKTLELANNVNAIKDINILESLAPYPNNSETGYTKDFTNKIMKLREFQGKYNIGMPATYMENLKYFVPSPVYTLKDLSYYFTDVFEVNQSLYQYLYKDYDVHNMKLKYEIPMIFVYGENDWTTHPSLYQDTFEKIQSPRKEMYIIKNAAHRPMNDNPQEFNKIILNEVYSLAK